MKIIGIKVSKLRLFGALLFIAFLVISFTFYGFYLINIYAGKYFTINYYVCLIVSFVLHLPFAYYEIKAGCNYWTLKKDKLIYMHPVHFIEVIKYLFGVFHGIQMDVRYIKSFEFGILHGKFSYGQDTYGLELHVRYRDQLIILPMNVDYKQRLDMIELIDQISKLNPNIKFIDNLNLRQHLKNNEVYTTLRDAFNEAMETKIKQ